MEYIQNTVNINPKQFNNLSTKFNLHPEIIKLLFARGVDSDDKIERFLNPSINEFHNPFLLKNMSGVIAKLKHAVENKYKIVILGDYDTDGISASAILYKFFVSLGADVDVFLPNRFVDGYGLNNDTIDKVINMYKPQLILTVDCGISNYKEVEYCKGKGVDIIITDHHDIPEIIPDTPVVDPKLEGQDYPFRELCGAGVALKLVHAYAGLAEALKYTTIASLATVADIVPLIDENRSIVYHGLQNQTDNLPVGLVKLCKRTKIELPLTAQSISYKLAPKINAAGRMGDAKISFMLYICDNDKDISHYIAQLLAMNDNRLNSTSVITEQAMQMLENVDVTKLGMIVLHNPNWESGVLGIICAKLVEKYGKPVCVLSEVEGEYKGSCRSIPGINIYEVLSSAKDLLIRFGGHNQAGGLSLTYDNIDAFTNRVNDFILSKYDTSIFLQSKSYDIDANKVKVNYDFLNQLDRLEPFGFGNPRPTYKLSTNRCAVARLPKHPEHLKVRVGDIEIICYSTGNKYYNLAANCNKEFLVDISIEKFGKSTRLAGRLIGFNYGKLNGALRKEVITANYLSQLQYLGNKYEQNDNIICADNNTLKAKISDLIAQSPIGTLLVASTYSTYEQYAKLFPQITSYELYQINSNQGENTLLLAPNNQQNFVNYDNIIFLDAPLCMDYVKAVSANAKYVYVLDSKFDMSLLSNLSTERNVFGYYHNAIKDYCAKNIISLDLPNCFKSIKKLNPQYSRLTYDQFYFVAMVLNELGILEISGGDISYNKKVTNKLTNSSIYNFVNLLTKVKGE